MTSASARRREDRPVDALLHAEVMAIAATEIAWSTPVRVTSRYPLGRGMAGLLLRDRIWSSWGLRHWTEPGQCI